MRWLFVLSLLVVACGNSSHVGECGKDGQECCFYPDDTIECNGQPTLYPNQDTLVCKGYPDGARYCVHCGYEGELCCYGTSAPCVKGLTCSSSTPATATSTCQH